MTTNVLCLLVVVLSTGPAAEKQSAAVLSPELEQQAYEIGKFLRCPVCQGMPIAESPATMAQDMMARVKQMLAEGKSREEILAYFEARYGEWALLEPKAEGFNLLVWLAPPLGLVLGLLLLWRFTKRMGAASSSSPAAGDMASLGNDDDPYLRAVREEVER